MPEIDRLNNAIDGHFEMFGGKDGRKAGDISKLYMEKIAELVEPVDRCLMMASMRVHGTRPENEEHREVLKGQAKVVEEAQKALDGLRAEIKEGKVTAQRFKDVTFQVMVARRATYPLVGESPWDTVTPEDALNDDNDVHSFAIWDSVVEPIQEKLPALHQLACEDWEDTPEEEDDDDSE